MAAATSRADRIDGSLVESVVSQMVKHACNDGTNGRSNSTGMPISAITSLAWKSSSHTRLPAARYETPVHARATPHT